MNRRLAGAAGGLLLLLSAASALGARPRVYALTGGTAIVAPGKSVEHATLVLRDGLIEAVGAGIAVPPDAVTIDVKGSTIYAAFIDAAGFTAPADAAPGGDGPGGGPSGRGARREAEAGPVLPWSVARPERKASESLQAFEGDRKRDAAAWRRLGFAAVLSAPPRGVFRGESALVLLADDTAVTDLILRDGVFQHVAFETAGFGEGYPTSTMGAAALVRQTLLDARRDALWWSRYAKSPRGMPRPDVSPALAALRPVLDKTRPLSLEAGSADDVLLADRIAKEFGVDLVAVASGTEAELAPQIAATGRTLIVPATVPDRPKVDDPDGTVDVSLLEMRRYLDAASTPKRLAEARVPFALSAHGLKNLADFSVNLRKILDAGLSETDALAALTTIPAKLCGVDATLGTLEAGKIANVVVSDGPPFAKNAKITRIYVDGTEYVPAEPVKPKGDPNAVVDPRGTWSVSIDLGGRTIQRTWTIAGAKGAYSGTAETRAGTVTFEKVELAGNALTVTFPPAEGRGANDVTVIVTGDRFEGTLDMGGRSAPVQGTRTGGPGGGAR